MNKLSKGTQAKVTITITLQLKTLDQVISVSIIIKQQHKLPVERCVHMMKIQYFTLVSALCGLHQLIFFCSMLLFLTAVWC